MRLLSSSLAPLARHAERKSVALRVEARGEIPFVAVDRNKLAWCVATLAGNALRYVTEGHPAGAAGTVLVHQVEHQAGAEDTVAIVVRDDGPGIPASNLPYLFESRAGVLHADGLALMLIRDIVAAHQGRIEVETQSGTQAHGTTVTLRFPRGA